MLPGAWASTRRGRWIRWRISTPRFKKTHRVDVGREKKLGRSNAADAKFCGAGHPARGIDLEPILSNRYEGRAYARCAGQMARATCVFHPFSRPASLR